MAWRGSFPLVNSLAFKQQLAGCAKASWRHALCKAPRCDVVGRNIIGDGLRRAGRWAHALQLLELNVQQALRNTVVSHGVVSGLPCWQQLAQQLRSMRQRALELNVVLRNALVAACGSWPRATELYELLGPDVLGVNGQLKRLPWHRATVLVHGMLQQGLRATTVTYNSMMNLVEWPRALQLLHALQAWALELGVPLSAGFHFK